MVEWRGDTSDVSRTCGYLWIPPWSGKTFWSVIFTYGTWWQLAYCLGISGSQKQLKWYYRSEFSLCACACMYVSVGTQVLSLSLSGYLIDRQWKNLSPASPSSQVFSCTCFKRYTAPSCAYLFTVPIKSSGLVAVHTIPVILFLFFLLLCTLPEMKREKILLLCLYLVHYSFQSSWTLQHGRCLLCKEAQLIVPELQTRVEAAAEDDSHFFAYSHLYWHK